MYKTGHQGLAMILYSPVGLALLLFGLGVHAIAGFFTVIFLSTLPDIDMKLPIKHRGPTHTVWFAIGVGIVIGIIFAAAAQGYYINADSIGETVQTGEDIFILGTGLFGLFIGFYGIVAHILGDVITPMGVRPFAPVKKKRYRYVLTKAASDTGNYLLWVFGICAILLCLYLGIRYTPV